MGMITGGCSELKLSDLDSWPHRPITDEDLQGCVVMACSVLELAELIDELRRERLSWVKATTAQFQILKAFGDLYEELTDETERRRFLRENILKAEREAARLHLPLWFWRPEPEFELRRQLYRRADFLLYEQRACLDDVFDLLREFANECASDQIVTDEQISDVIESTAKKGIENACASTT